MALKRRFQQYWRSRGIPDIPSENELTRADAFVGGVVTTIVGGVLMAPFVIALQAGLLSDLLPRWLFALSSLVLAVLGFFVTVYVGGPIADHLLDIPREVSE